jgi:hypothetical protein
MAVKYWYVASNGNSNWNVNSVWYNGPGGTGGVANIPTSADDVIINAASGSGTLTITATANCSSLNTSAFTGTLAGGSGLSIVSAASTGATVLSLGGTLSYTGIITISGFATNGVILANGKTHGGAVTINATTGSFVFNDLFTCTGTLTLTGGSISGTTISVGILTTSNSNTRTFNFTNLYLSGVISFNQSIQTGLTWSCTNIYLTNTTSNNKSITLSGIVSCTNLYLQGSGASSTTITVALTANIYPNVYIDKPSGTLIFGTSFLNSLTFVTGTTIAWASSTNTLTMYGNVTLCSSMSITSSNYITFSGTGVATNYTLTTFGKTFTGTLTINDQNFYNTTLTVVGDYTSTTISSTAISIVSSSSVTFQNNINVITAISINSTNGSTIIPVSFNTVTAGSMAITLGNVTLNNTYIAGTLSHSSGTLTFNSNTTNSIANFSSSNSGVRTINLNNAIINLIGNTGNVWTTNTSINLTLNSGTSTIVITDPFSNTIGFVGGAANTFYTLKIDRSSASLNFPVTSISGTSTFYNFIDVTQLTGGGNHNITFSSGQTVNIYDTFQVGNSSNITYFTTTSTGNVLLNKINPGIVIVQNCNIQNSNALQANNWFAIEGSVDSGGNTNWVFNTLRRSLSALGVG